MFSIKRSCTATAGLQLLFCLSTTVLISWVKKLHVIKYINILHAFPAKRQGASCRQAAVKGCHNPNPCWTRQIQSKTQPTVGTVLSIWTARASRGRNDVIKECPKFVHAGTWGLPTLLVAFNTLGRRFHPDSQHTKGAAIKSSFGAHVSSHYVSI